MTAAHPFRPSATRLTLVLAAGVLGVVIAAPGAFATPGPGPAAPPATVRPSATTTTSTSTSTTSSTSSTSTTSTSSTSTTSTSTTSTTLGGPVVLGPASVLTAPDPLSTARRATAPSRSTVRSGSASGGTTGAELPFTGGGTTLVLVSGLAALAMGAFAVWWGSRKSTELDAPEPGATG